MPPLARTGLAATRFGTVNMIQETNRIATLLKLKKPGTWFALDIDNTLARTPTQLGSTPWFSWRIKKAKRDGESFEKALNDWTALQFKIDLVPVEQETATVVRALQETESPILGLTARGMRLSERTVVQLNQIDIQFALNSVHPWEIFWPRNKLEKRREHILYEQGILFASGQSKGTALTNLLNKIDKRPREIVFIDDSKREVKSVAKACDRLGIHFIGLHYTHLNPWRDAFNPDLAETQLNEYNHIIKGIIHQKPSAIKR